MQMSKNVNNDVSMNPPIPIELINGSVPPGGGGWGLGMEPRTQNLDTKAFHT